MDYYNVTKNSDTDLFTQIYKNKDIINTINNIQSKATKTPNRLGVVFTTNDNNHSISNTLWCLMTKTLPHSVQPPHCHNSIALDYCVSGTGYTLLSQDIDENNNLIDPIKIHWTKGQLFVTPPGWWHSHHSTDDKPGFLFPVQDAGLHLHLDTLNLTF
jgi:gentisate 1,2-dioxygenase